MNISRSIFLFAVAGAAVLAFLLGYGIGSGVRTIFGNAAPAPCEIVTKRRLEPGKVIECPTQDTSWGCDTTYYYRLP